MSVTTIGVDKGLLGRIRSWIHRKARRATHRIAGNACPYDCDGVLQKIKSNPVNRASSFLMNIPDGVGTGWTCSKCGVSGVSHSGSLKIKVTPQEKALWRLNRMDRNQIRPPTTLVGKTKSKVQKKLSKEDEALAQMIERQTYTPTDSEPHIHKRNSENGTPLACLRCGRWEGRVFVWAAKPDTALNSLRRWVSGSRDVGSETGNAITGQERANIIKAARENPQAFWTSALKDFEVAFPIDYKERLRNIKSYVDSEIARLEGKDAYTVEQKDRTKRELELKAKYGPHGFKLPCGHFVQELGTGGNIPAIREEVFVNPLNGTLTTRNYAGISTSPIRVLCFTCFRTFIQKSAPDGSGTTFEEITEPSMAPTPRPQSVHSDIVTTPPIYIDKP